MNSASSLILVPLSAIYTAVTQARLAAYRRGLLSVTKLPAPVISIGNMTTGGTGKTPLVEWVCRAIAGADDGVLEAKKVCILTRGYARANLKSQVVVSNGTELLANEREAGDEPFLHARNLLGVAAVVCNPNRVAAGQWAIENLRSEVFVLDDGFQHLHLSRNLNIVVIDATNPWGGGSLLPFGRLREPLNGLSRADCVVVTRTEQVEDLHSIEEVIRRFVPKAPIFSSQMLTASIRTLDGRPTDAAFSVAQPVGAFCGVGNPASFFNHLGREGYQLTFTRAFADHHHYKQLELDALVQEAKTHGANSLITTEKDATKLSSLNLPVPCYVLSIRISVDEEESLVKLIRDVIIQHESRD